MSVTVRTILLGLSYLATFIFAANGVGLAGERAGGPAGRRRACRGRGVHRCAAGGELGIGMGAHMYAHTYIA